MKKILIVLGCVVALTAIFMAVSGNASAAPASAVATSVSAAENPLLGKWQWISSEDDGLVTIYKFRSDGIVEIGVLTTKDNYGFVQNSTGYNYYSRLRYVIQKGEDGNYKACFFPEKGGLGLELVVKSDGNKLILQNERILKITVKYTNLQREEVQQTETKTILGSTFTLVAVNK
ncbi:MAG: hypothetical protein WC297_01725 [Candidatus Paceibacterota bacterium]|jgi:ABC-type antimicrobial peptide transport system permease subunit